MVNSADEISSRRARCPMAAHLATRRVRPVADKMACYTVFANATFLKWRQRYSFLRCPTISAVRLRWSSRVSWRACAGVSNGVCTIVQRYSAINQMLRSEVRSEERRVGKECRCGGWGEDEKE